MQPSFEPPILPAPKKPAAAPPHAVDRAQQWIELGEQRFRAGDLPRAFNDFGTVAKMEDAPKSLKYRALNNQGVIKAILGEYDEAAGKFNQIVEAWEASSAQQNQARLNLGVQFSRQSRWDDAVASFDAVIHGTQTSLRHRHRAYSLRGLVRAKQGRYLEAVKDLAVASRSAVLPADQAMIARCNRAVVLTAKGKFGHALAEFQRVFAAAADPRFRARLRLYCGLVRLQQAAHEWAIKDFQAVIDDQAAAPLDVTWACLFRGVARGQLGQFDAACQDFESVLGTPGALAKQQGDAAYYAALTRHKQNDRAAAVRYYDQVSYMFEASHAQRQRARMYTNMLNAGVEELEELGGLDVSERDFQVGFDLALT